MRGFEDQPIVQNNTFAFTIILSDVVEPEQFLAECTTVAKDTFMPDRDCRSISPATFPSILRSICLIYPPCDALNHNALTRELLAWWYNNMSAPMKSEPYLA